MAQKPKDTGAQAPKDTGAQAPKDTGAAKPKDTGAKTPKITNAQIDKESLTIGQRLRLEPKVTVVLNSLHGDKFERVIIGGYKFDIPTGVATEVPESVYKVIQNKAVLVQKAEKLEESVSGEGKEV